MITKKCNFHSPRVGVFVLRCCRIGDTVKMLDFIEIFYSTPKHRAL